jgi:hypothetical protein
MIRPILTILLGTLFMQSCSQEQDSKEFLDVYGAVLTQRVIHKNDIEAQFAVDSVLEANGYSLETFGSELERFSTNDPDFSLKIDSLRTYISEKAANLDSVARVKKESDIDSLDTLTETDNE